VTVTNLPIWIVDVAGSAAMIVLSLMCLHLALKLKRVDQSNVIWTYLAWVCYALCLFAFSRGAGHILKQVMIMAGKVNIWEAIRPLSGSINTLSFIVVSSVTLFFHRTWIIYRDIQNDKLALKSLSDELFFLNRHLEHLVTERTKEVAVSERKYRRIFEASRDLILVAGKDGAILELNPEGYAMLRLKSMESLKDKNFRSFFSDEKDWERIEKLLEQDGFVTNMELELKRSDGSRLGSLVSGSFGGGLPGKEETIHFLVKDIEQRKLMEKQMAQADKLASIGQLSAGIAHEINNPLGVILGYTQLLIRNEKTETDRYNDLRTIEKHVKNCKSIVEDLLNFARSSKPEIKTTRINEAADDVLNFVLHHSKADGIDIVRNYDEKVPPMMLDEKKIRQVLVNLLMNAVHAVGKKGIIRLSTEYIKQDNSIAITVADTGYGIEKKNLARIFDPFFTTKPTGEGTGLGLSVSYGIVKSHGGEILVESEPGKGARFTVVLPVIST
jgi:two-component system, NtrC family, sensor kinase